MDQSWRLDDCQPARTEGSAVHHSPRNTTISDASAVPTMASVANPRVPVPLRSVVTGAGSRSQCAFSAGNVSVGQYVVDQRFDFFARNWCMTESLEELVLASRNELRPRSGTS